MHWFRVLGLSLLLGGALNGQEAEVVALFKQAGARVTVDGEGHATKLFSGGKPAHSVADLQRLGELGHLEQLALNAPQAGDMEWFFLKRMPRLKQLTIWHCKTFRSLAPFNDLKIEGLTVGGCMGIRDLNKGDLAKQRDAVLTLRGLPELKRLNLYHSPLTPDDRHLAHIAGEFPKLEDLKLDFASPRGSETTITPAGLRVLKQLPLKVFSLENVHTFGPDHGMAIAEIATLEAVLVDTRRGPDDVAGFVNALKAARPDLEVVVAEKGAKRPPARARRK